MPELKVSVDMKNIEFVQSLPGLLINMLCDERIPFHIRDEYLRKSMTLLGLEYEEI